MRLKLNGDQKCMRVLEFLKDDPSILMRNLAAKLNVLELLIRNAIYEDLVDNVRDVLTFMMWPKSYIMKVRQMLSDAMKSQALQLSSDHTQTCCCLVLLLFL